MSNSGSRIVVALALVPVVLGAVYLGGWWLFALVAFGAAVALHEFWLLARPLAPLSPAGYIGAALALVGAELCGLDWMIGGVLYDLRARVRPEGDLRGARRRRRSRSAAR